MSPNEFTKHRNDFAVASFVFGWQHRVREVHHERDWDYSSQEEVWVDQYGNFLFRLGDLSEGLCKELIRIFKLIGEKS